MGTAGSDMSLSSLYYRFIALTTKIASTGKAVERISDTVSALRKTVSSSRNSLYIEHLNRIFPHKNQEWFNHVLSRYWKVHERNLFALFYLKSKVFADLENSISWTGREHLDSAFDKNRGVLLLVPHFGDERSLHVILGMAGYPVDVITSRYSDMSLFARESRLANGRKWNNLHFPDENPRWMFRTLLEGRILHYASTAYGGPGGTWINNFGIPVLVPSAPWKLRRRTGCEVLMASCSHTADMGFHLKFTRLDPADHGEMFTKEVGKAVETLASECPSQYEWKNLVIRHRESNTISRIRRIPEKEAELEKLAIPVDSDPSRVLTLEGIMKSLNRNRISD